MKYYTKEWYESLQNHPHTSGLRKIPDKDYTDQEIEAFYQRDLKREIARDRSLYNTPPLDGWIDTLLTPERFCSEDFLFIDEETGQCYHPSTIEIAKEELKRQHKETEERFASRPPFDPAETIACFQKCYRTYLRHAVSWYPDWLVKSVDKRLLALNRIPMSAYKRLRAEEKEQERAYKKWETQVCNALEKQDIPDEIRSSFQFHDAYLLSLKKKKADWELYLRKDGEWFDEGTPYIKVIFKNIFRMEREKGLVLRKRLDEEGELFSNCQFLYHELYRDMETYQKERSKETAIKSINRPYEIHMLLWTFKALRYLTICCEDIRFEDNISKEVIW